MPPDRGGGWVTPATKRAGWKVAGGGTTYDVDLNFKHFLATVEGLLLPDKPSVPGKSRLNMSPFPRSRYRANPHLHLPPPRVRVPRLKRFP